MLLHLYSQNVLNGSLKPSQNCSEIMLHMQLNFSKNEFLLFLSQYISSNPGVQGAYMPQYPPLHAAPVSFSPSLFTAGSFRLF